MRRDDANRFDAAAAATFLDVVRADRAPVHACDVAIAQNSLGLRDRERFLPPRFVAMRPRLGTRLGWFARAWARQQLASRRHRWAVAFQRADWPRLQPAAEPKIAVGAGFFPVK